MTTRATRRIIVQTRARDRTTEAQPMIGNFWANLFRALTGGGGSKPRPTPTPTPDPTPQPFDVFATVSPARETTRVFLRPDLDVERSTVPDANGRVTFTGVPARLNETGAWIVVEAPGYRTATRRVIIRQGDAEGGPFDLERAWTSPRSGVVMLDAANCLLDAGGRFYAYGTTMFYAIGHWRRGGAKRDIVLRNLDWLAARPRPVDYVRILGQVDWPDDQGIDPSWPDYGDAFDGVLRAAWERGIRCKVTAVGGGLRLPLAQYIDVLRAVIAGRRDAVLMVEGVNEGNDSRETAIAIARELRNVALTATGLGNQGIDAILSADDAAGSALSCFHTERSYGDPGEPGGRYGRIVRQCWDFKEFRRRRQVENAEPPGLTSSVTQLNSPGALAAFRVGSIVSGSGMFCAHTGHGVFGRDYDSAHGRRVALFEQAPGMGEFLDAGAMATIYLPLGVDSWSPYNGGYGGSLNVDSVRGPVQKNYGARNGNAFVQIIFGCTSGDAPQQIGLRALRPLSSAIVYDPQTGRVEFNGPIGEGEAILVGDAWSHVVVGQVA